MRSFRLSLLGLALVLMAACQTTTATSAESTQSRLDGMTRHDDWADIAQGSRTVKAYVVYPERSTKAPVVMVIHENRGLTDWVRTVADELAKHGYIAVAPDLLSGMAPGGGATKDFPTEDAARQAIGQLPRAQVLADLRAVADYARKIPAANGKLAVGGFCWGGSRTWDVVTEIGGVNGAFVFYGTGPHESADVTKITAPVFGFYGGNDERVNATIPKAEEAMKAAGKRFEPVIYPGAGHAFMRLGELPDSTEANRNARTEAWAHWLKLLASL